MTLMKLTRTWLWVVLFIWLAALLAGLATGWNVVVVQDHQRMLELSKTVSSEWPWLKIALGTLGFVAALLTMGVFFVRLLREMKLTQVQSDFIARVSHELRTPIASMELAAGLLKRGGLSPDEESRLWESHHSELRRLRTEVDLLLEATRYAHTTRGAQRSAKTYPRLRLDDWIAHSLPRWERMLREGAHEQEARISLEGSAPGIEIEADPRMLDLIGDNLVDNARKYAKGAAQMTIRTTVSPGRTPQWKIEFSDQGWGFPPEEKKRIFQRFYRAQPTTPRTVGGTGLGLFLAVEAARSLNLQLTGKSPGPGRGATFSLEGRV